MQTAVRRRLYGFIIQRVKSMFFSKSFCLQSRGYADRGVILVEFFAREKESLAVLNGESYEVGND